MVFKNIPKTEGFVLLSFLIYSIFLYLQCTNYTPIVLPPKIVYVDKPVYIPVKQIVTTPTQVKCMAEAIYFEGRNQSDTGEKAIAHVIVNRVTSGVFPKTICGVVHDGCQFSYSCSHRIKKIKEPEEYKRALDISNALLYSSGSLIFLIL